MAKHGTKDASFAAIFGTGSSYGGWTSTDFYAEFNAWLATNPDPGTLKPTATRINEVLILAHDHLLRPLRDDKQAATARV